MKIVFAFSYVWKYKKELKKIKEKLCNFFYLAQREIELFLSLIFFGNQLYLTPS